MYARIAFPAAVQWEGTSRQRVHTLMMVCGESKRSRQMTPPGVAAAKLTDSRDLRDISNSRRCASLRNDRDSTRFVPQLVQSQTKAISLTLRISLDQFKSLHGVQQTVHGGFVNPNSDANWVTPASGACSPM